jgi:hypothetical protein
MQVAVFHFYSCYLCHSVLLFYGFHSAKIQNKTAVCKCLKCSESVQKRGIWPTILWYGGYQVVVRIVPLFGTRRTRFLDIFWYDDKKMLNGIVGARKGAGSGAGNPV